MVGGDFNLERFQHERKGGDGNGHDRRKFDSLIADLGLMDLLITGRDFTWSNLHEDPYLAKLDRILGSTD